MSLFFYWRRFGWLFSLLVVLSLLDWWLTWVALSVPGGVFYEMNPIASFLFGVGAWAPLLAKLVSCVFVFFGFYKVLVTRREEIEWCVDAWIWKRRHGWVCGLYYFVNIVSAYVVVHNVVLLFPRL